MCAWRQGGGGGRKAAKKAAAKEQAGGESGFARRKDGERIGKVKADRARIILFRHGETPCHLPRGGRQDTKGKLGGVKAGRAVCEAKGQREKSDG